MFENILHTEKPFQEKPNTQVVAKNCKHTDDLSVSVMSIH